MSLEISEHRDATVAPYTRRSGTRLGKSVFDMGVFDAGGACVETSLLRRRYGAGRDVAVGVPARFDRPAASEEIEVMYFGPLFWHYGHFLLESLARVWAVRGFDGVIAWSCPPSRSISLRDWQKDILRLLGIENRILLITRNTRFNRVMVPEVGYKIQHEFHPEQANALGVVSHEPRPGHKVWLSRSRLQRPQNVSMPRLEARIAERGWTVIHPETLPVPEQVAHLAAAERIAGEEGSALHSLMFLRDIRELRVDIFLRDPEKRRGDYNKNYYTIARGKSIDQLVHYVRSEVVIERTGNALVKTIDDPAEYERRLNRPVHEAPDDGVVDDDGRGSGEGPMTLDDLAKTFNTDKASVFVNHKGEKVRGHGYAGFYEGFFEEFTGSDVTVMELGCGPDWNIGASLRMLRAYLPKARIVGVDNKESARSLEKEGIEVVVGDLGEVDFLRSLRKYNPTILIDDASHIWTHQVIAMIELYDCLPRKGIYVMEDINTSFGKFRGTHSGGADFSAYDFVSSICTTLHSFGAEHLRSTPYAEYIRYLARQTAYVAQFRHTAVFVRA